MARRFAEDTKVPTSRTQDEVKRLLKAAGSDQIAVYESSESSAVAFRIDGRLYRITVPIETGNAKAEQEERRAWRLLLLLIKAKMEAVREGATTVEREFLADMLMPDKSTVHEWLRPQIAIAYDKGEMPSQLLLSGGGK